MSNTLNILQLAQRHPYDVEMKESMEKFSKFGPEKAKIVVPEFQNYDVHKRNTRIVVQSQTSIPSSLLNPGQKAQFRLDSQVIPGAVTSMYASITIANAQGSAVGIMVPVIFERVELTDAQGKIISSIWLQDYFYAQNWMDDVSFKKYAPLSNQTSSQGQLATLANSASATYEIFLDIGTILKATKLVPGALGAPLYMNWYSRNDAYAYSTGSVTGLTVSGMSMNFVIKEVDNANFNYHQNIYANNSFYRWIEQNRMTFSQSYTTSTAYTFQLTAFNRMSSGLMVYMYDPTSNAGLLAPLNAIASIDILDATNRSVLIQPLTPADNQLANNEQLPQNSCQINKQIYIHSYGLNLTESLKHGLNLGVLSHALNGPYQIRVTTNATMTPGAYVLVVTSFDYRTLQVNKNNLIAQ